jgi:hypothetical protein
MTLCYVPAGGEGYSDRTTQIQITNKPNEAETSEHGKLYKRWRAKEKTIVVVNTSTRGGVTSKDQADVIVPTLSSSFLKNCGITKVLANPIHGGFIKEPFEQQGIESIVDSGGFQMLKGTVDFVDPTNLVKLYNVKANIAMPLDLPVPSAAEHMFWDPVSKMIKANDDFMLKHLKPGIDLAIISHGSTLARRKSRLDVLDRKARVIAIAGLGIKPAPGVDHVTTALESLMYVVQRYHKSARYFHVLGITSKFWLFIYALLDSSGYVKSIGADSVSHRLGALVGMYDTYDFQTISLHKKQTYHQAMPCNCPVCFALDDIRIVNNTYVLEAHNLWVRAQWAKLMSDMAYQYVKGTVKLEEIYKTLNLTLKYNEFHKFVKYAESIIEKDKFTTLRQSNTTKSLFRSTGKVPNQELYTKILRSYEKFHSRKFL